MASHLSSIGFAVDTQAEFMALAQGVAARSETLYTNRGTYFRWVSPSGAELWLQVDPDRNFVGMNPHFTGPSRVKVRLTERLQREGETCLDGGFKGWADPDEASAGGGAYPFVFDAPDYEMQSAVPLSGVVQVQVAAFAHELEVHDSPESYDRASEAEATRFASRSFVPAGLVQEVTGSQAPLAQAVITGHVLAVEKKVNEYSGLPFWWCLVDSYGGTFDLVADPELVTVEPRVGGVVSGAFWLSGRIVTSGHSLSTMQRLDG